MTDPRQRTHLAKVNRKKLLDDDEYERPLLYLLQCIFPGAEDIPLNALSAKAKRRLYHFIVYQSMRMNSADSIVGIMNVPVQHMIDYHRGRFLDDTATMDRTPNPRFIRDNLNSIVYRLSRPNVTAQGDFNQCMWMQLYVHSIITEYQDVEKFFRCYSSLRRNSKDFPDVYVVPTGGNPLFIAVASFYLELVGSLELTNTVTSTGFYQRLASLGILTHKGNPL